jgi:ABC-2 type transport system ATP-binding protein
VFKIFIQSLCDKGKAVFFCSHVLEVVEKVCSQLIILRKGRVISHGPTTQVLENIGQSSLESTFLQLVEDRDVAKIASDIVDAVVA